MMAARLTDMTAHGGMITGPGCPTVLIGKMPAARMGDMHMCPMVTPGVPPIPHVGGPIVGGCPTVLIGKMPAARQTDMCICVGPPSSIVLGCPTVFIGSGGAGGGGGGGGSSTPQAKAAETLKAGTVSPVKGTETYPIEIQAIALAMQEYCTPEGQQLDLAVIDALAQEHERKKKEESEKAVFTIADVAEILKSLETEDDYEAARHFASECDFDVLCSMARKFVEGKDTDSKNDPNLMPTRFMILYGADDSKLKEIDKHPDGFEGRPEHTLNVVNLKKALRLMGSEVDESGLYDDKTHNAHVDYIRRVTSKAFEREETHCVEENDTLGSIASKYGLPTWKYLYQLNKDTVGDNPDVLIAGTVLKIPVFEKSPGCQLLRDKGVNPFDYIGGTRYKYPWVPVSLTIANPDGTVYREFDEHGNERTEYAKKKKYEIKNADNGNVLVSGEISKSEEISVLVPDVKRKLLVVAGIEYQLWKEEKE